MVRVRAVTDLAMERYACRDVAGIEHNWADWTDTIGHAVFIVLRCSHRALISFLVGNAFAMTYLSID